MKRPYPRHSKLKNSEQSSPGQVYPYALKLLAARDYTVKNLGAKLRAKGFGNAEIGVSLARLVEEGWLNDLRFAERFAESAVSAGRFYGSRLKLEMRRRGISDEMIDEVLGRVLGEHDECAEARSILERRFPGFSYVKADAGERRRVMAFMLRRGFGMPVVLRSMRNEEL